MLSGPISIWLDRPRRPADAAAKALILVRDEDLTVSQPIAVAMTRDRVDRAVVDSWNERALKDLGEGVGTVFYEIGDLVIIDAQRPDRQPFLVWAKQQPEINPAAKITISKNGGAFDPGKIKAAGVQDTGYIRGCHQADLEEEGRVQLKLALPVGRGPKGLRALTEGPRPTHYEKCRLCLRPSGAVPGWLIRARWPVNAPTWSSKVSADAQVAERRAAVSTDVSAVRGAALLVWIGVGCTATMGSSGCLARSRRRNF